MADLEETIARIVEDAVADAVAAVIIDRGASAPVGGIPEAGAAAVTIERAAEILGIGRSTAYDLIRQGEFPVRILNIGRRRMVPLVHLERFLLGTDEDGQ